MADTGEKRPQREFLPFWEGLRAGYISFPKCEACGRFHWYPMKRCPHCKSDRIAWAAVKGEGTLYSHTTVRFPFSPDYRDKVPYVVALVEFPDAPGVRLITDLVGVPQDQIRIGMKVKPVKPAKDEAYPTVNFTAA